MSIRYDKLLKQQEHSFKGIMILLQNEVYTGENAAKVFAGAIQVVENENRIRLYGTNEK